MSPVHVWCSWKRKYTVDLYNCILILFFFTRFERKLESSKLQLSAESQNIIREPQTDAFRFPSCEKETICTVLTKHTSSITLRSPALPLQSAQASFPSSVLRVEPTDFKCLSTNREAKPLNLTPPVTAATRGSLWSHHVLYKMCLQTQQSPHSSRHRLPRPHFSLLVEIADQGQTQPLVLLLQRVIVLCTW